MLPGRLRQNIWGAWRGGNRSEGELTKWMEAGNPPVRGQQPGNTGVRDVGGEPQDGYGQVVGEGQGRCPAGSQSREPAQQCCTTRLTAGHL